MSELNFSEELKIDPMALDVEWLDQPAVFMKYAEAAAQARDRMDKSKEKLEVVRAGLDKAIRSAPGSYGMDKVTESAIQNTIVLEKEYQDASAELGRAKYDYDMAQAAVRAFDQRKESLEYLVKLMNAQYFAPPKEPRDLNSEYIKKAGQRVIRSQIKTAMNPEKENVVRTTSATEGRRRRI